MYAAVAKEAALNRHLWAVKRFHFARTQCLFLVDYETLAHVVIESFTELDSF